MATISSILAWRILWTEEPGGLQSVHGIAKTWTRLSNTFTFHGFWGGGGVSGGVKTICEFIYLYNHIKIGLRPQMFLPKLVRSQFLNFRVHQSHQESLLEHTLWGPTPKSFWFSRSGVGPSISMSNKSPWYTGATGSGPHFDNCRASLTFKCP